MKRWLTGVALVVLAAAGVHAQSTELKQKSQTKIDVKEGREVTVTGCVAAQPGQNGFALSDVSDRERKLGNYLLVGDVDDVREHIGHFVEIRGKVADRGNGKVEVKTNTEVERNGERDSTRKSKTQIEGDLSGLPFLAVEKVKMIRPTCD
jgi:hypothetical protein